MVTRTIDYRQFVLASEQAKLTADQRYVLGHAMGFMESVPVTITPKTVLKALDGLAISPGEMLDVMRRLGLRATRPADEEAS